MPGPSHEFELHRTGQPRAIMGTSAERSVTCVSETSSVCSADRPASAASSPTCVPDTSSVCSADRPASGARSLTCVPGTSSVCSADRPASGPRSATCVSETSSACRADKPASGARSLTCVRTTSSVWSADRPASGARSLTCVSETYSVCSADRPASGARSLTFVLETFSVCSADSPVSGARSLTFVRQTYSVCSADRPARGDRSLTCVSETSSVCSADRPASGARSLTCVSETSSDRKRVSPLNGPIPLKRLFLSPVFRLSFCCHSQPSHSDHALANDRDSSQTNSHTSAGTSVSPQLPRSRKVALERLFSAISCSARPDIGFISVKCLYGKTGGSFPKDGHSDLRRDLPDVLHDLAVAGCNEETEKNLLLGKCETAPGRHRVVLSPRAVWIASFVPTVAAPADPSDVRAP